MSNGLSRTSLGLLVGVSWGLVLGFFGPWLVVLLGPPVALLICPERAILSWQSPLVAAAVTAAIAGRNRGDTGSGGPADTVGSLFVTGFLMWLMTTLFSCPWAFIFQRRAQRAQQVSKIGTEATASRVGAVLLVFLACGLVLVGFAVALYPMDSADPRDQAARFYGLLIAAVGVALSVGSCRIAHKLGMGEAVKQVLELPLIIAGVAGVLFTVAEYIPVSQYAPSQPASPSHAAVGIWAGVAALEAVAGLIWLTKTNRRATKAKPDAH
jgi:hypothetical protein